MKRATAITGLTAANFDVMLRFQGWREGNFSIWLLSLSVYFHKCGQICSSHSPF